VAIEEVLVPEDVVDRGSTGEGRRPDERKKTGASRPLEGEASLLRRANSNNVGHRRIGYVI
jgi:hypothetical protein